MFAFPFCKHINLDRRKESFIDCLSVKRVILRVFQTDRIIKHRDANYSFYYLVSNLFYKVFFFLSRKEWWRWCFGLFPLVFRH
ncbi:MAG: hypothetical protein CMD83_18240 [Gammaproteobacteria bacterium]|nr:hypothetical protein [Gammaproteobacteria bacterium]